MTKSDRMKFVKLLTGINSIIVSKKLYNLIFAAGQIKNGIKMHCQHKNSCPVNLQNLCGEAIRKHLLKVNRNINLFDGIPKLGLPS